MTERIIAVCGAILALAGVTELIRRTVRQARGWIVREVVERLREVVERQTRTERMLETHLEWHDEPRPRKPARGPTANGAPGSRR